MFARAEVNMDTVVTSDVESMTTCHVLLADGNSDASSQLSAYLARNDFLVTTVDTAKQMLDVLAHEAIDLLLLERRLRGEDGLHLARAVRDASSVPIVVLSGKDEEVDRVIGLELGADDYVTKPFSQRELLARIRAVLRRYKAAAAAPAHDGSLRAYRFAGWELNIPLSRLRSPDGSRVAISRGQFRLLRAFLSSPQRILTRGHLLEVTHLHAAEVYDRSIDVQIVRLRRKMEVDLVRPRFIKTERGMGYYFDVPVSEIR
jgi:two-component system OmpR family response regulator